MLELRPEVNIQLLEQTRFNSTGFDKVDYTYNLLHHCRKIQRQMLRARFSRYRRQWTTWTLGLICLTRAVNPCRAPSIAGAPSVHKLTRFSQLMPSFCWKLSTTLKMSAPVAVVVSSMQNRNSSLRSMSPSYLT